MKFKSQQVILKYVDAWKASEYKLKETLKGLHFQY